MFDRMDLDALANMLEDNADLYLYEYSERQPDVEITTELPPWQWRSDDGKIYEGTNFDSIRLKCSDCQGSGKYYGFNVVEMCQKCNGHGSI